MQSGLASPLCVRGLAASRSGGVFARRACKPDFVQGFRLWMTIPLPTVLPRRSSCQPGPLGRWHPCGRYRPTFADRPAPARGPYLALLRVGLAVPVLSPVPRWAFTPPFHRYPACRAVSSLWRFPWGCPRRALPGTLANGSPDFPRGTPRGHPALRTNGEVRFAKARVNPSSASQSVPCK